jgi:hypothetical protein
MRSGAAEEERLHRGLVPTKTQGRAKRARATEDLVDMGMTTSGYVHELTDVLMGVDLTTDLHVG